MVKIIIQDVNDHRPVFYPAQYNVNLAEDSSAGTEIVAVQAQDADAGVFGTVSYSITSGNNQALFTIDANTGMNTKENL